MSENQVNENQMSEEDFIREEFVMDERDLTIEGKARGLSSMIGKFVIVFMAFVFQFIEGGAITWTLFMVYFLENAIEDAVRYKYYKTKGKLFYAVLNFVMAICACILMIAYIMEP